MLYTETAWYASLLLYAVSRHCDLIVSHPLWQNEEQNAVTGDHDGEADATPEAAHDGEWCGGDGTDRLVLAWHIDVHFSDVLV